jgi:hypothetical protein
VTTWYNMLLHKINFSNLICQQLFFSNFHGDECFVCLISLKTYLRFCYATTSSFMLESIPQFSKFRCDSILVCQTISEMVWKREVNFLCVCKKHEKQKVYLSQIDFGLSITFHHYEHFIVIVWKEMVEKKNRLKWRKSTCHCQIWMCFRLTIEYLIQFALTGFLP